ncbi:MAG: hypothetical protein AAF637_16000 [Pseudomonadota bacterium]
MQPKVLPSRTVTYELEIQIGASAAQVWRELTENTNSWWLPDFHVAAPDSTVTLDAVPGGQLVERTSDGGGIVWYTVQACRPGISMTLLGSLSEGCGPGTTMLTIVLEEDSRSCVLRLTDVLFGHISDELVESLRSGWVCLLGEGLGRYTESTL